MVRMDEMVSENPEMESLCAVLSNLVVSNSATPWTVRSPPGSSVHGILQTRIMKGVAILSSRGSSQPRD